MPVHVIPFPHVRVSRMLPIVLPQRLFMTNAPHAELSRRFELSRMTPQVDIALRKFSLSTSSRLRRAVDKPLTVAV